MSTETPSRVGRKKIFTERTFRQIAIWVKVDGLSRQEIADNLGCKVSTLKVMCNRARVKLYKPPPPELKMKRRALPKTEINLDAYEAFYEKADSLGMRTSTFLRALIEVIAEDNLWDAVLDPDKPDKEDA